MTERLKPCRFCGGTTCHIRGAASTYYVMCFGCRAEGPVRLTQAAAAEAWNAPLPPSDAVPPYDPTAEMLDAGVAALRDGDLKSDAARVGAVWRAMGRVAGVSPEDASPESDAVLRELAVRLAKALSDCMPLLDRAEDNELVGDEGCLWPVELARDALADARAAGLLEDVE